MSSNKSKFGDLQVQEGIKEKRGTVKFFNSATYDFKKTQENDEKPPSYKDIDSLTPEEPSDSLLSEDKANLQPNKNSDQQPDK
ncbi:hypothetical protein M9Y10_002276 [Tritrichomonas musculus]|uniref:Uncharacterized protein n=1 Tax=Tritrichomonas musculus TaxID=1915356 RepID=A0ABR2L9D2_9EUKA